MMTPFSSIVMGATRLRPSRWSTTELRAALGSTGRAVWTSRSVPEVRISPATKEKVTSLLMLKEQNSQVFSLEWRALYFIDDGSGRNNLQRYLFKLRKGVVRSNSY